MTNIFGFDAAPVLVLAPHTDDGELGCGGAIARCVKEGYEVYYAAFSSAEESLYPGFPPGTLRKEVLEATAELGLTQDHVRLFDYPVRRFPEFRQAILEDLIKLREEIKPKLILLPNPSDIHQDHEVIYKEGLRAFKRHTMLGYELPWNNIVFSSRCFVVLDKEQVEKKIKALNRYESQRSRAYLNPDYIWSLARTRGTQIEGGYAEAFDVIRWIVS